MEGGIRSLEVQGTCMICSTYHAKVFRYKLIRLPNQTPLPPPIPESERKKIKKKKPKPKIREYIDDMELDEPLQGTKQFVDM